MENTILARIAPNAALLINAAGSFLWAGVLLLSDTAWGWLDLRASWREPLIVALFAFSVLLVVIARYRTRSRIALAVMGNIAWIIAGAYAVFETGSTLGAIIISAVIVVDAILALFQARGLREPNVVANNNAA